MSVCQYVRCVYDSPPPPPLPDPHITMLTMLSTVRVCGGFPGHSLRAGECALGRADYTDRPTNQVDGAEGIQEPRGQGFSGAPRIDISWKHTYRSIPPKKTTGKWRWVGGVPPTHPRNNSTIQTTKIMGGKAQVDSFFSGCYSRKISIRVIN